jgi:competence protein ComEC
MQAKINNVSNAIKKFLPFIFIIILLFAFWTGGCDSFSSIFEQEVSRETDAAGTLTVHFIDVGQGDAIFIQAPEKNILIDGGERNSGVVDYLQNRGVTSLDLVLSTHPHNDHIGGLLAVLENIPVQEVIDPGVVHTTKTFEDYLTLIDALDIKFTIGRAGLTRELGESLTMQILHPADPSASRLNDASLVTKFTFGKVNFLFTGDAEEKSEARMLRINSPLQSTVLKIGHHGSSSSTSAPFLEAVNPVCAVIMVGANNKYEHPHEETLQTLAATGVNVYRTDHHGTITITTDGETFHLDLEKNIPLPGRSEGNS